MRQGWCNFVRAMVNVGLTGTGQNRDVGITSVLRRYFVGALRRGLINGLQAFWRGQTLKEE